MTEPPHEQQTVEDIAKDLLEYEPVLRGVVVFTIDRSGTGRLAMGGAIKISELRVMINTLQLLETNQGKLHQLMGMEAKGNA
jgi:hypothetical protein